MREGNKVKGIIEWKRRKELKRLKQRLSLILMLVLALPVLPSYAVAEGAWGQINQPLSRPANWQRIAEQTPFALGEKSVLSEENGVTIYEQGYGFYPCLDGSTVAVPLGMELARQILNLEESDLGGFVTFSTTHSAYERLIGKKPNPSAMIASERIAMDDQHPVDLILATEPSKEELQMAADAGVTLQKAPFCYDAFVFLVNIQNPVNNLTMEQIRQVYTGEIMNWQTFGGLNRQILPFQREPNSGSQTAMENLVMQGLPMAGTVENFVSDGMCELIAQIGNYDNGKDSIGYSYLYYVENLYRSQDVKVLSVNGVAPTPENLRNGTYPLTTSYYAVYREGEEIGAAFAQWLYGEQGQECVAQAGYIPVVPGRLSH